MKKVKLYHGTDRLKKKREKIWNASSDNIYFWNEENREKSIQNAKITGSLNFIKYNNEESFDAVVYEITVDEDVFDLFEKDLHEGMEGAYCINFDLLKSLYNNEKVVVRKIIVENVTTPIMSVFTLSLLQDLNMDNVDTYWRNLIEDAAEGSIKSMDEYKNDKYYPLLETCIEEQDFLPLFMEALKKYDDSAIFS